MPDRPIIFSAPMIQALLDGSKTQTRRLIKRGPLRLWLDAGFKLSYINAPENASVLPYQHGDRLWVREGWKPGSWRDDGRVAVDYHASPELTNTPWLRPPLFDALRQKWIEELEAAGSTADASGWHRWQAGQSPLRWRSPIHMPRWASRLTLTVTDVRVQRLQDISEEDAQAEGIHWSSTFEGWTSGAGPDESCDFHQSQPEAAFRHLWDRIHGSGAWNANPEVVALAFTVERRNIDG